MLDFLHFLQRVLAGADGVLHIGFTLSAAIRSFVLPHNEVVRSSVVIFSSVRLVFDLPAPPVPALPTPRPRAAAPLGAPAAPLASG